MKELYRKTFDEVHASERLREEVRNMKATERNARKFRRPTALVAVMILLVVLAGTVAAVTAGVPGSIQGWFTREWTDLSGEAMPQEQMDLIQELTQSVGVSDTDTEEITDKMVDKMCKLRIFEDENGKTNCSLADVDGEILLISQFTLYADCSHGNRPGFTGAGNPELANHLYEHALARCAGQVRKVEHGIFGADMKVELLNDGPFTILLDSDTIVKKK